MLLTAFGSTVVIPEGFVARNGSKGEEEAEEEGVLSFVASRYGVDASQVFILNRRGWRECGIVEIAVRGLGGKGGFGTILRGEGNYIAGIIQRNKRHLRSQNVARDTSGRRVGVTATIQHTQTDNAGKKRNKRNDKDDDDQHHISNNNASNSNNNAKNEETRQVAEVIEKSVEKTSEIAQAVQDALRQNKKQKTKRRAKDDNDDDDDDDDDDDGGGGGDAKAVPVDEKGESKEKEKESEAKKAKLSEVGKQEQPQDHSNGNNNSNSNSSSSIDLSKYSTAGQLEALGLDALKEELMRVGLKCGGTLKERADRLWLLKNARFEDLPKSVKAKK